MASLAIERDTIRPHVHLFNSINDAQQECAYQLFFAYVIISSLPVYVGLECKFDDHSLLNTRVS